MRDQERESHRRSYSAGLAYRAGEMRRAEAEYIQKMKLTDNEVSRELCWKLAQRAAYQAFVVDRSATIGTVEEQLVTYAWLDNPAESLKVAGETFQLS